MAHPLLLILLLGGAAALALKKPSAASASKTPVTPPNALPPPEPGSQTVQVPVGLPNVLPQNQPQVTVTVPPEYRSPGIAQTSVPVGVPSPMVDGTGWVLADDGSDSLAIKSPAGDVYKVPRTSIITAQSGATIVQIRPDLQVVNPQVVYVTTEATPPGTSLPANVTPQPTPQQVITNVASQVAQVLGPQAATVLAPPVAVQTQESTPALDPHGTIALAAKMINAESSPGWKTALAGEIKRWQIAVGFKGSAADGMFGPGSAVIMGKEVGVLPLLRYYLSTGGTDVQQLTAYRTALGKLASSVYPTNPAHSLALRSSAMYEQCQGYSTTTSPVPATARVKQASDLNAAIKGS